MTRRLLEATPTIAADAELNRLLQAFAETTGGGSSRNRRRRGIALNLYRGLQRHLHLLDSPAASDLLVRVNSRLAEVEAQGFVFTASLPLLPDGPGDYAGVFDASESAPGDTLEEAATAAETEAAPLFNASEPTEVAAPITPPRRSRSPVSGSAFVHSPPKPREPPQSRPRVDGIKTPTPPAPRPKYLGVRTPSPPKVDPGSRFIVTRPKRRARPIEDGSSDDYHSEYPSIEESFVPKASGVPVSSGCIGDWTSEQWREYNQRQEAASSSTDRAVPAPSGHASATAGTSGSIVQPLRVLQCFNAPAAFARDLEQALEYRGGVRYILSLDYHGVFDRCYQSTGELLRNLNDRPEVLVLLCSKCSTDELIENAVTAVGDLCRTNGYGARHFPCLFIPRPDKSAKLWQALSRVSALERLPLMHVDDKWSIVEDFNRWGIASWRGIHLPVRGRRELAEVVLPAIAEWR